MKVLGRTNFMGNAVKNLAFSADDDGVEFAGEGRIVRVQGRLLMGVTIVDGQTTSLGWVQLLQEKNTYTHEQQTPSTVWTVQHNMNSTRLIVQPWPDGEVATAQEIITLDADTVQITFNVAVSGVATIMVGNIDGLAKPDIRYEQPFTSQTTVTVNHNLGYDPAIRVLNAYGMEILNYELSSPSVNQSVLTFTTSSTGTVYCL
jgi:hypothetical protein